MTEASRPAATSPTLAVRLYAIASRKGWTRRLLLAFAAIVFLLCLIILLGGSDYRQDPSALVPRSADLFVETRDLDRLLKNIGHWRLWDDAHRVRDDEPRNLFQIEAVQYFTSRIPDLGTYIPFLWLTDVKRAALAVAEGEVEGDKAWALYLETADVNRVMAEMRLEPKIRIEGPTDEGEAVFELVGENGGSLFLGTVTPWIIVSSDRQLPEFAVAIMKKPSLSLANAKVLPAWSRRHSLRGMVHPAYLASRQDTGHLLGGLGGWVDAAARVAFTADVDAGDKLDASISVASLTTSVRGGGAWPIIKLVLFLVAVACAVLIAFMLLVMIGWGAKLKLAAMNAGIVLAPKPEDVTPSEAFTEDAGGVRPVSQENQIAHETTPETTESAGAGGEAGVDKISYSESAISPPAPATPREGEDSQADTKNDNKDDFYL